MVAFYAGSWIGGDLGAVRQLLDPEAEIEWNLDLAVDDEELVQTLTRISAFADEVTVFSRVHNELGAALVYDCAAPFGTARMAEFLTIDDGRITRVRQIYDAVAINRYFPGLVANEDDEYYED